MPSVRIKLDLTNDAFVENAEEIGRVIDTAAHAVNRARAAGRSDTVALFDINGNRVGEVRYTHR